VWPSMACWRLAASLLSAVRRGSCCDIFVGVGDVLINWRRPSNGVAIRRLTFSCRRNVDVDVVSWLVLSLTPTVVFNDGGVMALFRRVGGGGFVAVRRLVSANVMLATKRGIFSMAAAVGGGGCVMFGGGNDRLFG